MPKRKQIRGEERGVNELRLNRVLEMRALVGNLGFRLGARVCGNQRLARVNPQLWIRLKLYEPEVARDNGCTFLEIGLVKAPLC